eukprot:839075_1
MGSLFSHWDDDPFFVDSYNSPFIYYFDLILLPISCLIVTIIFLQWVYELHCSKIKKTITKSTKKDTSEIGSKSGSSKTKNKPKPQTKKQNKKTHKQTQHHKNNTHTKKTPTQNQPTH